MSLPTPTLELVRAAEKEFDGRNGLAESALAKLFRQFPANTETAHVLLKVVVLNRLYSTNIFAVEIVAHHIAGLHKLDQLLKDGSPKALDLIAEVNIAGVGRSLLSFATKYCNWHNHTAYPIFDSNVDKCLWAYKKQDGFARYRYNDFFEGPASVRRERFFKVITAFRDYYHLTSVTFKQLDKFLWLQGNQLAAAAKAQPA